MTRTQKRRRRLEDAAGRCIKHGAIGAALAYQRRVDELDRQARARSAGRYLTLCGLALAEDT